MPDTKEWDEIYENLPGSDNEAKLLKKEKAFRESLEKDRTVNPHLAMISDHLWWLALSVKIGLGGLLITILLWFIWVIF